VPCGGYDRRVDAAETFLKLVGGLEYPMFIVTARAGDEPLGCLVGFATQTSIAEDEFSFHRAKRIEPGHEA
jgi:flavin reductase (DIM6/NTAB) family NADH-FMN oxidoreductase RutF